MPWVKQFDVDAVLGKAMEAFWARGYEATSMQHLVDATGVNRASLYATYGDKHALFLAALRMYDDRRRRALLNSLDSRPSARDAIGRLFASFTADVSERGGSPGCFLTNTALELAAHDREARTIVARAQEEIEAFFERTVRRGQVAGEFGSGLAPRAAARGLLATLLGVLVLVRSRPDRALLGGIVDDALARLT